METETYDSETWTRSALDGEHAAFGRLVEMHQPRFMAMASRMLGNRCDAEDILQDSFLAVYRHRANFRHASRFSTWMYSIVSNRIRNHLRHARVLRWSSLDFLVSTDEGERTIEYPDGDEGPEVSVANKLEVEAIRRETDALPPCQRDIFRMHYFEELSLPEVARRMGRPLSTVKVYLHRSRNTLRRRLAARTSRWIPTA